MKSLNGITAFLNGQEGLDDMEEEILDHLDKLGLQTLVLDNLFEEPEKLNRLTSCNNLVLGTTGFSMTELKPLYEQFIEMKIFPKKVVFMSERTAIVFLGLARELKKSGTKFYFPDTLNMEINEIEWI